MQTPRSWPDQLGQSRLDVHMDVFVLGAEDKDAAFDLRPDLVRPALIAAPSSDDRILRDEHRAMRPSQLAMSSA
jgi:hypothetical protein